MEMDEREIGRRLRARRLRAGLTQAELASKAGVSVRTLSELENGRGATLRVTLAIAQPLGGLDDVLHEAPLATTRGRSARLPRARSTSPRREDRKSFELHRAIVRKLRADPAEVIRRASEGIDRLQTSPNIGPHGQRWVKEWRTAIDEGPQALERLSLRDDDHGASLRQVSPFFGVLTQDERLHALKRA